jgi:hypothetical protein
VTRRLLIFGASLFGVLALSVGVWAYFTTTGSGTASASVGTLTAPGQPTRTGTGGTVDLSWTAATVSGGGTISYHVERSTDPVTSWSDACGTTVSSGTTSTSCTDTPSAGTYRYRVTALFTTWTATGGVSDAFVVTGGDTTPPYVLTINRADPSPTNLTTVHWTVTFSESVTGVDTGDFALAPVGVSGASITSVSGSGSGPYTLTVNSGSGDGSLGLNLVDNNSIVDGASNPLGDSVGGANGNFTGQAYTIDKTGPSVTINQAVGQSDPTGASPINFTVVFSESVSDFASGDVTLAGTAGATTATVTGSGTTYNVAVSGLTASGTVIATVGAAKATDGVGNVNAASTSTDNTVTYDTTPYVLSIDRAAASPTNAASVTWTVTFTRAVTGVDAADFALANSGLGGTPAITSVTGSGAVYTVAAGSGSGDGSLGLNVVDNNTIRDAVVNGSKLGGNGASDGDFTGQVYSIDRTAPAVTVNQKSGQADPTNALPILFTVTFNESVTGFDATDLTRSGTASGGSVAVTGSGASYEIAVTNPGSNLATGTLIFMIAAGVATDAAGNNNTASTSTDNTVTYDATAPTVTINQAAGQADPSNAPSINFTVVFSESVTGFTGSDVTLAGTAGATTATVTGSGATYNVAVSGMTGSGTVTASVVAAAANDSAGNASAASTSTDNTVTYDNVAPTVTINQAAGQADPTNASPINFTVVFSKSVTGFTTGDVTLAGTAGATTATVTGSGTTYNVAVTGMTTSGTVIATIAAARAQDTAGNANTASTSTDNTVAFDNVAPTVTINQAAGQSDPTNASPIDFTVVFSESVTGFASGDVTLGGTAGAATSTVTGSGTTYNVSVSGMTGSGTVIATVAAAKAQDAAGNNNTASTSTDNTVSYDATAPTVVSINRAGASATVNSGPLTWTVTFSEPVNGVATSNFALVRSGMGGTVPSITSSTATGGAPSATWTVSANTTGATGTNSGSIGLNLVNTTNIKDVATNNLSAATPVVGQAYTYDTTTPTVTINQAATQTDPTNAAHVNFTVTFSETVTGFTAANVSLGGTAGATTVVVTGSGSTYNVSVGGMTASGTVTASVTASSAQDAAGNQAQASTSTDNSVQFTATITITSPTENQSGFSRTGPFTGTGAPASSTVTVEFCRAATFTSACEAAPSASFTTTANPSGQWSLTASPQLANNDAYATRATATTGTKSSVVRHFHT